VTHFLTHTVLENQEQQQQQLQQIPITDSTVSSLEYNAKLRGDSAADRGVEGAESRPRPTPLPGLPTLRL